MTIEEAIQHCRDHARKQKAKADKYAKNYLMYAAKSCEECAAEHEQLAEWLTELKQRREAEITAPPKSNADRIRQMTDEELAKFLIEADMNICDFCASQYAENQLCEQQDCTKGILAWLKQEVSEDADN